MTAIVGAADLMKFQSGLKISDVKTWEPIERRQWFRLRHR
jgi:hypothetical protein